MADGAGDSSPKPVNFSDDNLFQAPLTNEYGMVIRKPYLAATGFGNQFYGDSQVSFIPVVESPSDSLTEKARCDGKRAL